MNNPLLGTWKLLSFAVEYQDTGQKTDSFAPSRIPPPALRLQS
jgi:hypothetical protein